MRKFYLIILLILSLFPFNNILAQSNAGFVPGNIWYSVDPFEEGDKIKIYTVLFNPDQREFSGTVRFFDKTTFLGKKDFIVGPRGVKDISIDWTATVGNHNIFAKIENAKFLISPGKYEEVYLAGNQTEESTRNVNKKIILKTDVSNTTDGILDAGVSSIENLGQIIEDKTPDIIAKPIIATTEAIENFRENIATSSKINKEQVKKDIANSGDAIEENKTEKTATKNTKEAGKESNLYKPFKYIKLFFLSLISFIFNNKIVFYGISVFIVFFILRYIWRLVF